MKSGLSQGYINQLESGKRKFTQKSLELIADALSIPLIEFFREDTQRIPTVAEEMKKYEKKHFDKKEFFALLKDLPEHIANHYLTLLRLETELLKKKT